VKKVIWSLCLAVLVLSLNSCGGGGGGGGGGDDDPGDIVSTTIGTLKYVPTGKFRYFDDETDICTITSSYWISRYEITREQFAEVLSVDPVQEHSVTSYSSGLTDPAMMVSWYDAIVFCNKLSIREGLTPAYSVSVGGTPIDWATLTYEQIPEAMSNDWNNVTCNWNSDGYRLPTSAEWSWAAMGAYRDAFSKAATGGIRDGINRLGWLKDIAGYMMDGEYEEAVYAVYNASRTSPVGTKKANELGLNDMSGNVNEWCWDWDSNPDGGVSDYKGVETGSAREYAGGCWADDEYAIFMCPSLLSHKQPDSREFNLGFRVMRP